MESAACIEDQEIRRIEFGATNVVPDNASRFLFAMAKRNRHAKVIFLGEK